jgi:hypothetical protein
LDKWYNEDFSEELCIFAIAVVLIFAQFKLGTDAANLLSAGIGGLIGYLTRSVKNSGQ